MEKTVMNKTDCKIKQAPKSPGVYLMKDKNSKVIYVGKAKNLKNRIQSYFTATKDQTAKTKVLVQHITDIDYILVKTELDALILERNLIKVHQPSYNIIFRDDKEYPYLKIDFNKDWPRLEKVRQLTDDKNVFYFGPFANVSQLRSLVNMVYRIFPVVRCHESEFKQRTIPCHYYHMKKCLGPCTEEVHQKNYHDVMSSVVLFLEGRDKNALALLKKQMLAASNKEHYELAAIIRDNIDAYKILRQQQHVVAPSSTSMDIFGTAQDENNIVVNILMFRQTKLIDQRTFNLALKHSSKEEALSGFMSQYYEKTPPPEEIIVPYSVEDQGLLTKSFQEKRVSICVPKIGFKKNLTQLSNDNATFYFDEQTNREEKTRTVLEVLKEKLHLDQIPYRMECVDISNTHKTAITASVVCFINGKPSKKDYRIYHIKTVTDKPDDYKSIQEVLQRRLQKDSGKHPDLMIIDGGKGQLAKASAVKKELKLAFNLISLAKSHVLKAPQSKETIRSSERIFFEDNKRPLYLEEGSIEYRILTHIRNEAHRFALKHHRKKRSTIAHSSMLDSIKGIGPKLKIKLFDSFHDMDGLKKASLKDLEQVKGLSKQATQELYQQLKN